MSESLDALNQKYLELRPQVDYLEKAKSLKPLYIRTELGRPVYLYENVKSEKLSAFGEVHPPAIADLFLAIMNKTNLQGENS